MGSSLGSVGTDRGSYPSVALQPAQFLFQFPFACLGGVRTGLGLDTALPHGPVQRYQVPTQILQIARLDLHQFPLPGILHQQRGPRRFNNPPSMAAASPPPTTSGPTQPQTAYHNSINIWRIRGDTCRNRSQLTRVRQFLRFMCHRTPAWGIPWERRSSHKERRCSPGKVLVSYGGATGPSLN